LSRRAMIALISAVGAVACVCGAWGISRVSRQLPAEELARLDGLCLSSSGTFSGEIHNGSQAWTIREVTIRLTLKEAPPGTVPNATIAPPLEAKSRDYQIRNLSIGPLETGHVLVEVLTPPGSEFVQWRPIDAKGFTSLWYGIEQTFGGSPVPSAIAEPAPAPQFLTFVPNDVDVAPVKPPTLVQAAGPSPSLSISPEEYLGQSPPKGQAAFTRRAAKSPQPVTLQLSQLPSAPSASPRSPAKVFEAATIDPRANPDPDGVESRPPNGSFDKAGGG
jgi:hypothetical protein